MLYAGDDWGPKDITSEISGYEASKKLSLAIGSHLYQGKGTGIEILDVQGLTLLADYFVIATGMNQRHVRALADMLVRDLQKPIHVEGYEAAKWILLDYGDVIVHVFREAERAFYGLERLWGDAPRLEPEQPAHPK